MANPIIAKLKANSTKKEWQAIQALARRCKNGKATKQDRLDLSLILSVAKDMA